MTTYAHFLTNEYTIEAPLDQVRRHLAAFVATPAPEGTFARRVEDDAGIACEVFDMGGGAFSVRYTVPDGRSSRQFLFLHAVDSGRTRIEVDKDGPGGLRRVVMRVFCVGGQPASDMPGHWQNEFVRFIASREAAGPQLL